MGSFTLEEEKEETRFTLEAPPSDALSETRFSIEPENTTPLTKRFNVESPEEITQPKPLSSPSLFEQSQSGENVNTTKTLKDLDLKVEQNERLQENGFMSFLRRLPVESEQEFTTVDPLAVLQGLTLEEATAVGLARKEKLQPLTEVARNIATSSIPAVGLGGPVVKPFLSETKFVKRLKSLVKFKNIKKEIPAEDLKNAFVGRPSTPEAEDFVKGLSREQKVKIAKDAIKDKAATTTEKVERFGKKKPKIRKPKAKKAPRRTATKGPTRTKQIFEVTEEDKILVSQMRSQISEGIAGKRFSVEDTGESIGTPSTFPKFFQNKGLTKKESLRIIDNVESGKPITARQTSIMDDLLSGAKDENVSAIDILQKKVLVPAGSLDLEIGDSFKIDGEKFSVKGVNDEGDLVIKDGREIVVDPFDKMPLPDTGSIIKASNPNDFVLTSQEAEVIAPKKNEPEQLKIFKPGEIKMQVGQRPIFGAAVPEGEFFAELPPMEDQLSLEVDTAIGDVSPPLGLSIKKTGAGISDEIQGTVKFDNPDTEARFQKAKQGVLPETLKSKIDKAIGSLSRKTTRGALEHLPRTAEFSQLRFKLLNLRNQKGVSQDRVGRVIQGLTHKFGPQKMDLFTRKVILDDLIREAKSGRDLPFGFTPKTAISEHAKISGLVASNPDVSTSIQNRRVIWDSLRKDYTTAMESIGLNVDKKLTNESYYRHQILEWANIKSTYGPGGKLKTPSSRGFLKKRSGSGLDINANYIEAEFEIMAQMFHDIEIAKVIKFVDSNHNIVPQLRQQAKQENFSAIDKVIRRELGIGKDEDFTLKPQDVILSNTQKAMDGFKQQIAVSISTLKSGLKLSKADDLPISEIAKIAEDVNHEGHLVARGFFKAITERKKFMQEVLGDNFKVWQDVIPGSHKLWQPREGNIFFMADSIPSQIASQINDGVIANYGLTKEDLGKIITLGGKRKQFVLPEGVADQLDDLIPQHSKNIVAVVNRRLVLGWKQWQLLSPRRFFKYNARNLTGDSDVVFAGNAKAFLDVPEATRELYPAFFSNKSLHPEVREWFNRGGFETTLRAQEITDVNDFSVFKNLKSRTDKTSLRPDKLVMKAFEAYWKGARLTTDYREAILRYANYKNYLKQIEKNNGFPDNYGASIREEVDALPDSRDKAFKLSNDLLGAYDDISVTGQALRENLIPFFSFKEVNFKRYIQLYKNARIDGKSAAKILKSAGVSPALAATKGGIKMAKFILSATAFWSMTQAWNNIKFPEDEAELDEFQRNRPHILLGRDDEGKIRYFSNVGSLGDFLSWFGLDMAPRMVDDWFRGKRTATEIALEMGKAPINTVIQGVTPTMKTPAEILARTSFFPDAFSPRPIRDRAHYLFRTLALGDEYSAFTGRPTRGYLDSLKNLFIYRVDPGQGAYIDIQNEKSRFLKKSGKISTGFFQSPKGEALYNLKLAIRYKDKELQNKFFTQYMSFPDVSVKPLKQSLRGITMALSAMQPLAGLNKLEKIRFLASLDSDDRRKLENATKFYNSVLLGGKKDDL